MRIETRTSQHAQSHHRPRHARVRALHGVEGAPGGRLLAGWLATGRAADLREHLDRYGMPASPEAHGKEHPLIDAVARAGLTGRGGAGFPTATKLCAVARAKQPERVVVANAMESEPVSAKDKALLRLAPHLVLDVRSG